MIGYKKYNDLILGGLIMSILNKLPIGGGASNSVPSEGWTQLPSAINTALGVSSFIIFNNEVYGFGGDFNEVASEYRH